MDAFDAMCGFYVAIKEMDLTAWPLLLILRGKKPVESFFFLRSI